MFLFTSKAYLKAEQKLEKYFEEHPKMRGVSFAVTCPDWRKPLPHNEFVEQYIAYMDELIVTYDDGN